MAWLETVTKDGKKYLRIGETPSHSGKFREPLGLEDNRRNRALAREQVQKAIEREIATGTFDYAKPFPDSPRVNRLGLALRELGAILKLARRLDHVGKDLMFYVDKTFADEGAIEDAPGES